MRPACPEGVALLGGRQMTKSKIFLVGDGANLTALEETGYLTEDVLQEFISHYPDLLPGDQIDPENPRRWLLVSREMGVPGDVSESGRWSLDHLLLDQDGIPTFVECKRAVDTRARREVVAQMLDYAANGVEYWSRERLELAAAETAKARGNVLDDEITALLGEEDADIEAFWEQVEANLRARKVRLVFVADKTRKELRRLVEFLNEEMRNVEVLAVEVKQFQQPDQMGQKALVPRVVGFTEAARAAKTGLTTRRASLTLEEFFNSCEPHVREFHQGVLDRAKQRGYTLEWGQASFSVRARFPTTKYLATFAYGYPGEFHFYFSHPFRDNSQRLRESILAFGVVQESGDWTLRAELTPTNLARVDEAFDFILDEMDKLTKA
jgi:hypothetical protein